MNEQSQSLADPWPRSWRIGALLLVALTGALAFETAWRNRLAVDDFVIVKQLPVIGPAGWIAASLQKWWATSFQSHDWRPFSRLTLIAQAWSMAKLGIAREWPYYIFNILAHAGVCALLLAAAVRWGIDRRAALTGALIFAAHPLHAEAVNQVVGRTELLAAGWMLAGFILWTRWGPESPHALWQQPLVFALAFGSKEHAALYPGFLALATLAATGDGGWRSWLKSEAIAKHGPRLAVLAAELAAVGAAMVAARYSGTGGLSTPAANVPFIQNPLAHMSFADRMAGGFGGLGFGSLKLLWPASLSPDYSWHTLDYDLGWRWPYAWLGLGCAALAGLHIVWGILRGGRGWTLTAGAMAAWALTSNVPMIIGTSASPRLWYWPSAAACLGMGWALVRVCELVPAGLRRVARLGATAAATVLLLSITWGNAVQWRDPLTFAQATLAIYPDSWRGYALLSWVFFRARKFQAGIDAANAAIKIYPDDGGAWGMRGQNEFAMGGAAAEAAAERDFRTALETMPNNRDVAESLAILLHGQGRIAECNEVVGMLRERGISAEKRLQEILEGLYDHPREKKTPAEAEKTPPPPPATEPADRDIAP